MRTTGRAHRGADLMFKLDDYEYVQQAAIGFDQPVDATWPLDEINGALADFYRSTMELPTLRVIFDLRGPIGYLIRQRDDRLSDSEAESMFWTCLAEGNLAHAGTKEFLVNMPRWNATPFDSVLGRAPMAAVGYIPPWGPELPVEPINEAIRLIMGQQNWPSSGAIYLYPVKKESGPYYDGLWLADRVDGMEENDLLDDAMFKSIREQNLRRSDVPSTYQRKRYLW